MNEFAVRLRHMRDSRALTRKQLASLAGLHVRTIEDLERADKVKRPTQRSILALARAFGTSPADLFGEHRDVICVRCARLLQCQHATCDRLVERIGDRWCRKHRPEAA